MQIGVSEAARRLGISVARVHQRIADGTLPAVRIGAAWVIDEGSLQQVREMGAPGRRLSARSSWAVVAASHGAEPGEVRLAPSERARAQQRLHEILVAAAASPSEDRIRAVAVQLRSMFRNRAERRAFRASALDLPHLRTDLRLLLSGLSHPASGVSSGDFVEGYVAAGDLDHLIRDHLLSSVPTGGNVVLHVLPAGLPDAFTTVGPLVVAVDLVEHRGPREERRAFELLRQIGAENPDLALDHKAPRHDRRAPR
jgi:excisionase family DNA binding protein